MESLQIVCRVGEAVEFFSNGHKVSEEEYSKQHCEIIKKEKSELEARLEILNEQLERWSK